MNSKLIKTVTIITMLCVGTLAHATGKNSFTLKSGTFEIGNTAQTLDGIPFVFEAESSSVIAFEYERELRNDFSIAAGLLKYSNKIISGSSTSSTIDSLHVMAIGRKYIPIGEHILPYIGIGVGISSANIDGIGFGPGFHGVAGLKLRFNKVSFIVESRYVSAKPKDIYSTAVDISGSGVFAGASLHF